MPQTVRNTDGSVEFDAATDAEVADLIATFEAATTAYDAAKADADALYGEHPAYVSPEYTAKTEVLAPFDQAVRQANTALSASRNLPVGTVVRFQSSAGWSGTDTDHGTITKVTEASYVIAKDDAYGSAKTARLDREKAHGWHSSYGGSRGNRSLSVVHTPAQAVVAKAEQAERNARQAAQNAERRAYNEAVYAAEQAQSAQARVLSEAQVRATKILREKHAVEYAALVSVALDVLAQDAPGREASSLPPVPTA